MWINTPTVFEKSSDKTLNEVQENLVPCISLLSNIKKPLYRRNYKVENELYAISTATELLLQALNNFDLLTELFPKTIISDTAIQYCNRIILRCSRKCLLVKRSSRHKREAVFPAGTFFRIKNGHLEKENRIPPWAIHPILSVLAKSLDITIIKAAEFVISKVKAVDEAMYNNLQYCKNTYHRTPPAYESECNLFAGEYIEMDRVGNREKLENIAYIDDSVPIKYHKNKTLLVFDEMYRDDYVPVNTYYNFYNRYGALEYIGAKFVYENDAIYLPISGLQENCTGVNIDILQHYRKKHPPYMAEKILKHNIEAVFLTLSIDFADNLNRKYQRLKIFKYIASSWIGDIKYLDLTYFDKKNIIFIFSFIDGISLKELIKISNHLLNNLPASATFRIVIEQNNSFTTPLKWEQFREYCSINFNVKLQADVNDSDAIINQALLKSSSEIAYRHVIISGFSKSGKIIVIGGGPKTGKSLFTSRLAFQISIGGGLWGLKMKKCKVLYIDTEMDEDDYYTRGIAEKQHNGFSVILKSDLELSEESDDDTEQLKKFMSHIRNYALKHKFEVVIIDCLYRLINESSGTQVNEFVSSLKEMKKAGILVIVVHHLNKSDIDPVDPFKNLSGHSNFQRAVDGGILLVPDDNNDDKTAWCMTAKFMTRSFRPIPDKEVVLYNGVHMLKAEYDELLLESGKEVIVDETEKLKRFFMEHLPVYKNNAISSKEFFAMMNGFEDGKWTQETIRRYKKADWLKEGLIAEVPGKPNKYYQGSNL